MVATHRIVNNESGIDIKYRPLEKRIFLYSDQDNTKYSLFNSYGQQVYTGKSSGNNHTINVEVLLPGMYFLYTHNKAAPTEKIFIY